MNAIQGKNSRIDSIAFISRLPFVVHLCTLHVRARSRYTQFPEIDQKTLSGRRILTIATLEMTQQNLTNEQKFRLSEGMSLFAG